MTLYSYRAIGAGGTAERGNINAASEAEAMAILRGRQVYPIEVRPSQSLALRFGLAGMPLLPRRRLLSAQRMAAFCRQFATLLDATIPYDMALRMIIDQTTDLSFKSLLSDVRQRVQEGTYLADAFAVHDDRIPPIVINMVRSGEASGTLGTIMFRLADHYDQVNKLQNRVTSAMVYPLFMMLFSLAVVVFMITFIIPKVTVLFENFDTQLPLPTRILIAMNDVLTGYWWLLLPAMLALALGGLHAMRTRRGALLRDRLELRIPLWRSLRRKLILQRFTESLATLLNAGVELKSALGIARDVVDNAVYLDALDRVIFEVQNRGMSLSVALRRTGLFPEDIAQMISIGEETATLPQMLEHVGTRLSQELTATLDAATALVEPVMILVMGVIVGLIVSSVLLPMLQLNQLLG